MKVIFANIFTRAPKSSTSLKALLIIFYDEYILWFYNLSTNSIEGQGGAVTYPGDQDGAHSWFS